MNKKNIIIVVSILVAGLIIAGLYGTFAASSTVTGSDNTYAITLSGNSGEVVVSANSSKTVIYQITNTNKGVVQYGVAYSGTNITIKIYYDSQDSQNGTIDYGENKFVKLYIENSGTTDSTVSLQTVLGYEKGGSIDSLKPSGYSWIEKSYVGSSVNLIEYINYLYVNSFDESKTVLFAGTTGKAYYAPSVNLMNDGLDSSGNKTNDSYTGNIRYYGSSPDNYIYFNCSDYSDKSTCEKWRIVGIIDGKVKLIRTSNLGKLAWDYDYNDGNGATTYAYVWDTASINSLLNNAYYNNLSYDVTYYSKNNATTTFNFANSGIGIKNNDTRNLISETEWHTYSGTINTIYPNSMYKVERTDNNNWTGNIGLLNVSDYAYASDLSTCDQKLSDYNNTNCVNTNWILPIITANKSAYGWLINCINYPWMVASPSYGITYTQYAYNTNVVTPVLYLDTNTLINSGDGSIDNPYMIDITSTTGNTSTEVPTCTLSVTESGVTIENLSSDVTSYGLSTSSIPSYGTSSLSLSEGTKYGHVKTSDGRTGVCSVEIVAASRTNESIACSASNYDNPSSACSTGYTYVFDVCVQFEGFTEEVYTCKKTSETATGYHCVCYDGSSVDFELGVGLTSPDAQCANTYCGITGMDEEQSGYIYSYTYGWELSATNTNLSSCYESDTGVDCTESYEEGMEKGICILGGSYAYSGSIECTKESCADGYTSVGSLCYK